MPLDPMIAKPFVANPFAAFQEGRDMAMQREMNQMQMDEARNAIARRPQEEAAKNQQRFFEQLTQIMPNVPKEQRAQVYGQIIQMGASRGAPMAGIPPQYDPQMDALWDSMRPAQDNRIGVANPSDFDPASLGEYNRTGDPSVLKRVYPPQRQQMPQQEEWGRTPFVGADGNTYVLSNLGNVRPVQSPGQSAPGGQAPAGQPAPPSQPAAPGGPLLPPSQNPNVQADKVRASEDAKLRVKAEADIPRMEGAFRQFSLKASEVGNSIKKAKKLISPWSTGVGSWAKVMPMTDARALNGALQSVRARISFDELTAMREASKTGGALGSVTERELDLLQNAVASLDQAQTGAQVKESLDAIEQHYLEATRLYQEMLADRRAYASGQAVIKPQSAPQPPGIKLPSGWSIEREQ